MRIYWELQDIPELAKLLQPERERIWQQSTSKLFHYWQTWAAALFVMWPCLALGEFLGNMAGFNVIGGIAGAMTGGFVYSQIIIMVLRRKISMNTSSLAS